MDTKNLVFKYVVTGFPTKISLEPNGKIIYRLSVEF